MIHFFKLIRLKNVLLLVLTQILIKYALLEPLRQNYSISLALSTIDFIYLIIATVFIAAAGYIINDIEDVIADKINKPDSIIIGKFISEKTATYLFITLNLFGVIFGYLVSQSIEKSSFFMIFVMVSAMLYIYSTFLKSIPLLRPRRIGIVLIPIIWSPSVSSISFTISLSKLSIKAKMA